LENMERPNTKPVEKRISELALEHAARRVSLIKKRSVSESVLKQRKKGVMATGYTGSQLFKFLKEGRKFIKRWEASQEALAQGEVPDAVEQDSDSAQLKKVKSFEQKLKSIQANDKDSVEQNGDSAQQEKS
jgi:hypothetical protein